MDLDYAKVAFTDKTVLDRIVIQGLDFGDEAYSLFKQYRKDMELALACIHIAWLYILSSFDINNLPPSSDSSEHSISYLHKALSIFETFKGNPEETKHLRLLMHNKPCSYYEGLCYYLLGLSHMSTNEKDNKLAFDFLNKSTRPKYLPMDELYWSIAHHKLGQLLSLAPYVIGDDAGPSEDVASEDAVVGSISLTAANTHYNMALKHPAANIHEIHFDLCKNYIALIRIAIANDTPFDDVLPTIERHLQEAVKGINSDAVHIKDAYKLFYRSIAMSEFKCLSLQPNAQYAPEDILDIVKYARQSLAVQPLEKNYDLHVFALMHFCKTLLDAAFNPVPSSMAILLGTRLLNAFSQLINRNIQLLSQDAASLESVLKDLCAMNAIVIGACSRRVDWVKKDHKDQIVTAPLGYRGSSLVWSSEYAFPVAPSRKLQKGAPPTLGHVAPTKSLKTKPKFQKSGSTAQIAVAGNSDEGPMEKFVKPVVKPESVPFAPQGIRAPPPKPIAPAAPTIAEAPTSSPPVPGPASPASFKKSVKRKPDMKVVLRKRLGALSSAFQTFIDSILNIFYPSSAPKTASKSKSTNNFDASDCALYILSALSKLSRVELVLQSRRLRVEVGAKYVYQESDVDSDTMSKWQKMQSEIQAYYPDAIPVLLNIDQLITMRTADLKVLFRTQSKGIKALNALEQLSEAQFKGLPLLAVSSHIPSSRIGGNIEDIAMLAAAPDKAAAIADSSKVTVADCAFAMDATLASLKEYFMSNFATNECLLSWHVPPMKSIGAQDPIIVIAIWCKHDNDHVNGVYGRGKKSIEEKDIVMKTMKSDLDQQQLRYLIQNLLSSLGLLTRRRWSASIDALRQLSSGMSMGEILSRLPQHIKALTITCPLLLRSIPWHLLYVEMSSAAEAQEGGSQSSRAKEIQIMDRYVVSMGPSMSLHELCTQSANRLDHKEETYKMTCIDGGYDNSSSLTDDGATSSQQEISCVSSLWSDETSDIRVFSDDRASKPYISTAAATAKHNRGFMSKFFNPDALPLNEEIELEEQFPYAKALLNCRVLHIVAVNATAAGTLQVIDSKLSAKDVVAQLYLRNCGLCVLSNYSPLTRVTIEVPAADTEGVTSGKDILRDNFDLVDAFLLAGATSVLHPMWDMSQGAESSQDQLGRYAHLLFMIKFYSELPKYSSFKSAAPFAIRSTQLWLRDSNKAEILSFLSKVPIFKALREKLVSDLESYIRNFLNANYTMQHYKSVGSPLEPADAGDKEGNVFGHFFYYGSFILNGHGGNIHHPKLAEGDDDVVSRTSGDEVEGMDDDEFAFEIAALKSEGNYHKARELEIKRRNSKVENMKRTVSNLGKWQK